MPANAAVAVSEQIQYSLVEAQVCFLCYHQFVRFSQHLLPHDFKAPQPLPKRRASLLVFQ